MIQTRLSCCLSCDISVYLFYTSTHGLNVVCVVFVAHLADPPPFVVGGVD